MRRLGILVLNPNQETAYFQQLGYRAKKFDFELYLFTPDSYEPTTNKINGKRFVSHGWMDDTFPLPSFIYDRCFYPSRHFKNYYAHDVQTLKENTTFIGHGLPGKIAVYHALAEDVHLRNHLPETEIFMHTEQLLSFTNRFQTIILKPIEGSQGKGIIKISDIQELEAPSRFFKTYLIQPYLSLNVGHHPFDIRILLQKNRDGDWMEQGRAVRVGKPGAFLSNLHAGGHVADYTEWMNEHFTEIKPQINQRIKALIEFLTLRLDKAFPRLFEIGLDIGIDDQGHVWILEVNSKPGHQVLEFMNNHRMYEAPFLYVLHLLNKKEGNKHGEDLSY